MKTVFLFTFVFTLFLVATNPARASLLRISPEGELRWNVLGVTDGAPEELVVTRAPQEINGEAYLALERADNTVQLTVVSEGREERTDVTACGDEILTLEARQKSQEIRILSSEGKFRIVQNDVAAETQFPIYIDTKDHKLSVDTDTGRQYILVMPAEAFESALRANVLTKLKDSSVMTLRQGSQGEVLYQLEGQKIISLFNLMELPVDVSALISASSGKIEEVSQPVWFQFFGFLFQTKEAV